MHISKTSLVNYRNFENSIFLFNNGVNTIIGENGSGKTNLFRAMRLLLDDRMVRSAYHLGEQDFCRSLDDWRGHWIIIGLEFENISEDEAIQSLFLHGSGNIEEKEQINKASYNLIFRPNLNIRQQLSELDDGDHVGMNAILDDVTIEDYETIFTGKSSANFTDVKQYINIVGDFENVIFNQEINFPEIGVKTPAILSLSKEISLTFIQALRDVVSEFHNNRTNPLLTLLKSKSGEIDQTLFQPISDKVTELNNDIEAFQDVQDVRQHIGETIKGVVGETYSPTSLSIKSDLSDEADKLFQSLKLFVGESSENYEEAIHELSLGGANLIFLTLKLLEFKYQKSKESIANFLLIEEPEAHVHTHIQKTLFDKLNYSDTQIIYSTHSTHISEVSNIKNINILGKVNSKCESYQPYTGLTNNEAGSIQRYLDAVRSNLLFAKSVILIEGDAEEILIPILVKKVFGISLDELGISLVNIRSTGFENIALLFHDERIKKRCSIITDSDTSIINTKIESTDSEDLKSFKGKCERSEKSGASRKVKLENFIKGNKWLYVSYAEHTFEVDFLTEGNEDEAIATLNTVYSLASTIKKSKNDIKSDDVAVYGRRILIMAAKVGKGWFANMLGEHITYNTVIPDYILDAIFFVKNDFSRAIWFDILNYRILCNEEDDIIDLKKSALLKKNLKKYLDGALDFPFIKVNFSKHLPDDEIIQIMDKF